MNLDHCFQTLNSNPFFSIRRMSSKSSFRVLVLALLLASGAQSPSLVQAQGLSPFDRDSAQTMLSLAKGTT